MPVRMKPARTCSLTQRLAARLQGRALGNWFAWIGTLGNRLPAPSAESTHRSPVLEPGTATRGLEVTSPGFQISLAYSVISK